MSNPNSNSKTKYLLIGSSAAGLTAALELRKLAPDAQIICITSESEPPYNKCFLVDYLAGEQGLEGVYLCTPEFLAQQKIEILYHSTVTEIRPKAQQIQLVSGDLISYDQLLIATGARAWTPPIPGIDQLLVQNLALNFYNLQDTLKLISKLSLNNKINLPENSAQNSSQDSHNITHVTIIGAGLTGLECADALWRRGLKVTVIDQSSQILNQVLDQATAQFLQQKIINSGVELILGAQVLAVAQSGDNFADTNHNNSEVFGARENSLDSAKSSFSAAKNFSNIKLKLSSQTEISTDLIILATGVQANNIKVIGEQLNLIKQQIQVNQFFETNLPNIWAAGDAILVRDLVTGEFKANRTWPDAVLHGRLAARSMFAASTGLSEQLVQRVPYLGQLAYYKSQLFNLDLVVCGNTNNLPKIYQADSHNFAENQPSWASFYYNVTKQLQGFVLVGDISQAAKLRRQVGI